MTEAEVKQLIVDTMNALRTETDGEVATDVFAQALTTAIFGGVAGSTVAYVQKNSNYTVTLSNVTIDCVATLTLTLPTAIGIMGKVFNIKNSGTGTVTVDAHGTQTIDGSETIELTVQNESKTIVSTGSNWIII
jgi:hypothetical protein